MILTLTGKNNVFATTYFPAIDLSDDDYEFGLMCNDASFRTKMHRYHASHSASNLSRDNG